jgi:hypothetical protein
MLSKCANPACSATFRYLHEGRLFHVAVGAATPEQGTTRERFWLCGECSRKMTVIANALGIQVVSLPQPSELQENGITAKLCDSSMSRSSQRPALTHPGGTYVSTCIYARSRERH